MPPVNEAKNAHFSNNQTTHVVSDFLKDPTMVKQALAVIAQRNFITESLFTQGFNAEGGAVAYHESVNQYTEEGAVDNEDFAIAEGSEFHQVYMHDVGPQVQRVRKYGIEGWITFEDERRNNLGVIPRLTTRMMNTMVKHLDTVTLNMLMNNNKIRQFPSLGNWNTPTYAGVYDELLQTVAMINNEKTAGGQYQADTIVMSYNTYANLIRNVSIRDLYIAADIKPNPYFVGQMGTIANLNVLWSPYMVDSHVFVLDKGEIGGVADEEPLQMKPIERDESRELYFLRAKRLTVAFLTDPGAIVRVDINNAG
jgi:hypothetical protein